jgi:hypothetical protein
VLSKSCRQVKRGLSGAPYCLVNADLCLSYLWVFQRTRGAKNKTEVPKTLWGPAKRGEAKNSLQAEALKGYTRVIQERGWALHVNSQRKLGLPLPPLFLVSPLLGPLLLIWSSLKTRRRSYPCLAVLHTLITLTLPVSLLFTSPPASYSTRHAPNTHQRMIQLRPRVNVSLRAAPYFREELLLVVVLSPRKLYFEIF